MIYTLATINGSEVPDSPKINISKSQSELTSAGNFTVELNNYAGYNTGKYQVGDELNVYASKDNSIYSAGSPDLHFTFNQSGTWAIDNIIGFSGLCVSGVTAGVESGLINQGAFFPGSSTARGLARLSFSGTGYVNHFNSGVTNEYSATVWVNPYGAINSSMDYGIFLTGYGTSVFSGLQIRINNGSMRILVMPDSFGNGSSALQLALSGVGNKGWNVGSWNFVAGRYDHGRVSLTLNDNTYYSGNNNIDLPILMSSSGVAIFGGSSTAGTEYFSGLMDDLRIYKRVLSEEEISSIYNLGQGTETITNENQKIFTGIVEDITYQGEGIKETMSLDGRDYSCRLMDRTVEPEVYTNLQPGSIVKDIIFKYTDNISTSGVQITGSAISRIAFNQIPVYDAIKQLADLSQNIFYVANDKDLHFEPPGSISSGFTFNNTNVAEGDFRTQRDTLFNQVWVYGDRYLDAYKETKTAGSPLGGSVFQLIYKPSNTQVTVSGGLIQPGGILNMGVISGAKYLVDYESRTITFVSGTTFGMNIPSSGNSVVIDYDRSLPIVKVGDNNASQAIYGKRVKVIVDKNIKDANTAEDIMLSNLDQLDEPQIEGNILIEGVSDLTPGQTCVVDFPRENVSNQSYNLVEINYNINKENCLHDRIITAKVSKKLPDITDKIKQMMLDIKKLQGNDISDADLITRYQSATGSFAIRQSGCYVYTRSIAGAGLIWGNANFGIWGSGLWADSATFSFILGNIQAGILGTSQLGINTGVWNLAWSGCYMT